VQFARGRIETSTRWLRAASWAMPLGFIAVIAGWTTTEAGRQPWTVYGILRTKDSVTPSLTATDVGLSWLLYVLAYLVIFGAGFILLRRLVRVGPAEVGHAHEKDELDTKTRAARPLSAVSAGGSGTARPVGEDGIVPPGRGRK
jgi:cytochrome d ubiquinol oxidase subunit I